LKVHIIKRVLDAKRDHWVWRLVRANLSRVASLMVHWGHVIDGFGVEKQVVHLQIDTKSITMVAS
jgi:hypothetical protein